MMSEKPYDFGTAALIQYIYLKRKVLIISTLLAAVVSMIVSFTIYPKFKSTSVIIPVSSASFSREVITDNYNPNEKVLKSGNEDETERMVQVLKSTDVFWHLNKKFRLMDHYDIRAGSASPLYKCMHIYDGNVKIKKTENMAVQIEVLDTDPQVAADMANEIATYYDTLMNGMRRERSLNILQTASKELAIERQLIKSYEDSLQIIRNLGINNWKAQNNAYYKGYARSVEKDKASHIKTFEKKIGLLTRYGNAFIRYRDILKLEMSKLSYYEKKYDEAKIDAETNVSYKYVVEKAYKNDKKAYPTKSLIVLTATFLTFLLVLFLMLGCDYLKQTLKPNVTEK